MEYKTPEFKLTPELTEVFKTLNIPFSLTSVAVLYKAFPEPMGELLEQALDSQDWGSYYDLEIRRFTMDLFDQGVMPVAVAHSGLNNFQKLSKVLKSQFRETYDDYRKLILDQVAKVLVAKHSPHTNVVINNTESMMQKVSIAARRELLGYLHGAPVGDPFFRIEGVKTKANIATVLQHQASQCAQGNPYAKVTMVQPVGIKAFKVLSGLSELFTKSGISYTGPKTTIDHQDFVLKLLSGDVGVNSDEFTLNIKSLQELQHWFEHPPLLWLVEIFKP